MDLYLFPCFLCFQVTIKGNQGHAGTVPMAMRRDPMAAAAESIVAIEGICNELGSGKGSPQVEAMANDSIGLVCTVGDLKVWPGASNVIPGQVGI